MFQKYLLLLTLFLNSFTTACECDHVAPFLKNSYRDEITVAGRVIFKDSITYEKIKTPKLMKIRITKRYKGMIDQDTMVITGSIGIDCREILTSFKTDSSYIFRLSLETANDSLNTRYSISHCGVNWLKIVSNKVIGKIGKWTNQSIPLDEFNTTLLHN
jgi:hypothetical protein